MIKILKWVLYFAITLNERSRYIMAKQKGCDCVASKDDMFGSTFYFDKTQPPVRRYLTYKEFIAK